MRKFDHQFSRGGAQYSYLKNIQDRQHKMAAPECSRRAKAVKVIAKGIFDHKEREIVLAMARDYERLALASVSKPVPRSRTSPARP
jgi:hypothetical protein